MEQPQSQSYHRLLVLALIGIVLFIIFQFTPLAFSSDIPETETTVTKEEAAEIAYDFASDILGIEGERAQVFYHAEKDMSAYLIKHKLFHQYNEQFGEFAPIEYYQVDIDDEFRVQVHMLTGAVIGWYPFESEEVWESTREDAENWLQSVGFEPSEWTLLEDGLEDGIWLFAHQRAIGEATVEIEVQMDGYYAEGLLISYTLPDDFVSWLNGQNNIALWYTIASVVLSLLLFIGAIIVAGIWAGKKVTFRHGLFMAGVFIVLSTINTINTIPAIQKEMTGPAVIIAVMINQVLMIGIAAAVYFAFIAGSGMWKDRGKILYTTWRDDSFGSEIKHGMMRGYLFAILALGLQAALFWGGEAYFDVSYALDAGNSPLNSFWPFLLPLIAWVAAISEEAMYRLFSIALFKKLLRFTLLAALLSNFIWALGHALYPFYPAHTRVIELTLLGFIFSYALLRHGFYTAMFAHATFNLILFSVALFGIGGALNIGSGLFHIVSPAIIALLIHRLHRLRRKRHHDQGFHDQHLHDQEPTLDRFDLDLPEPRS